LTWHARAYQGSPPRSRTRLIQQALERRLRQAEQGKTSTPPARSPSEVPTHPEQHYRFDLHPGYQQIRIISEGAHRLGIDSPFFKLHEGIAGATTRIDGREYINYASYNYLALSGHPEVAAAARQAIDQYGTSVSASRLVSGERPVHRELEGPSPRPTGPTMRSPSSAATRPTSRPSATSSAPRI
jgi:8-amino-7-oxononanoate synthase